MKGNKKLLIIAALLFMLSVGFTTYAIYRETTTATGTVGAAGWSVKVKKASDSGEGTAMSSATLTFTAADIDWSNGVHTGKNNKIAPGDSGTISFTVNATGSEVDVLLTAAIDSGATLPDGFTATIGSGSQTITYDANSMTANVVVTITWTGTTADTTAKDGTDRGVAGTNISIPVNLTARQKLSTDA